MAEKNETAGDADDAESKDDLVNMLMALVGDDEPNSAAKAPQSADTLQVLEQWAAEQPATESDAAAPQPAAPPPPSADLSAALRSDWDSDGEVEGPKVRSNYQDLVEAAGMEFSDPFSPAKAPETPSPEPPLPVRGNPNPNPNPNPTPNPTLNPNPNSNPNPNPNPNPRATPPGPGLEELNARAEAEAAQRAKAEAERQAQMEAEQREREQEELQMALAISQSLAEEQQQRQGPTDDQEFADLQAALALSRQEAGEDGEDAAVGEALPVDGRPATSRITEGNFALSLEDPDFRMLTKRKMSASRDEAVPWEQDTFFHGRNHKRPPGCSVIAAVLAALSPAETVTWPIVRSALETALLGCGCCILHEGDGWIAAGDPKGVQPNQERYRLARLQQLTDNDTARWTVLVRTGVAPAPQSNVWDTTKLERPGEETVQVAANEFCRCVIVEALQPRLGLGFGAQVDTVAASIRGIGADLTRTLGLPEGSGSASASAPPEMSMVRALEVASAILQSSREALVATKLTARSFCPPPPPPSPPAAPIQNEGPGREEEDGPGEEEGEGEEEEGGIEKEENAGAEEGAGGSGLDNAEDEAPKAAADLGPRRGFLKSSRLPGALATARVQAVEDDGSDRAASDLNADFLIDLQVSVGYFMYEYLKVVANPIEEKIHRKEVRCARLMSTLLDIYAAKGMRDQMPRPVRAKPLSSYELKLNNRQRMLADADEESASVLLTISKGTGGRGGLELLGAVRAELVKWAVEEQHARLERKIQQVHDRTENVNNHRRALIESLAINYYGAQDGQRMYAKFREAFRALQEEALIFWFRANVNGMAGEAYLTERNFCWTSTTDVGAQALNAISGFVSALTKPPAAVSRTAMDSDCIVLPHATVSDVRMGGSSLMGKGDGDSRQRMQLRQNGPRVPPLEISDASGRTFSLYWPTGTSMDTAVCSGSVVADISKWAADRALKARQGVPPDAFVGRVAPKAP